MISWRAWTAILLLAALPGQLDPGSVRAAEFSAHMVLKDGAAATRGRIFIKGDKMRHEFLDAEGHTITIVRRDKKVLWVLLPQERTYTEIPLRLSTRLPGQFLHLPTEALNRRKVGQETVAGLETEKYEVLLPGGERGALKQFYWISPKLGWPVKMSCPEKQIAVEYLNIREESPPDRLFELPPDYRRQGAP